MGKYRVTTESGATYEITTEEPPTAPVPTRVLQGARLNLEASRVPPLPKTFGESLSRGVVQAAPSEIFPNIGESLAMPFTDPRRFASGVGELATGTAEAVGRGLLPFFPPYRAYRAFTGRPIPMEETTSLFGGEQIATAAKQLREGNVAGALGSGTAAALQAGALFLGLRKTPAKGAPGGPAAPAAAGKITPTLGEARGSEFLKGIEPILGRTPAARGTTKEFIEGVRKPEVEAAARKLGEGLQPQRVPPIPPETLPSAIRAAAPAKLAEELTQEASQVPRAVEAVGAMRVPLEAAEATTLKAVRGERAALRKLESDAWEGVVQEAAARGVIVPVEKLEALVAPLAKIESEARQLVTSSIPAEVLAMLKRPGARRAAFEEKVLNEAAESLGYESYDEMLKIQTGPRYVTAVETAATASAKAGPPPPTFAAVKAARTGVGRALERADARRASGKAAPETGPLKQMYRTLTEVMEDSLAPHPDLKAGFAKANQLSNALHETFDRSKMLREIVYSDPQQVLGTLLRSSKADDWVALQRALKGAPRELREAQGGVVDAIMSKAENIGAVAGKTVEAPTFNYKLALEMLNRPGVRQFLEGHAQTLRTAIAHLRTASASQEAALYRKFLSRLSTTENPRGVIRQIAAVPEVLESAVRFAGGDPQMTSMLAAGVYWDAVERATVGGRLGTGGAFLDSRALATNLRNSLPAIERLRGAPVPEITEFANTLEGMSLPTRALEAGKGQQFATQAMAVGQIGGIGAIAGAIVTGRFPAAIWIALAEVAPDFYMRVATMPGALRAMRQRFIFHSTRGVGRGGTVGMLPEIPPMPERQPWE